MDTKAALLPDEPSFEIPGFPKSIVPRMPQVTAASGALLVAPATPLATPSTAITLTGSAIAVATTNSFRASLLFDAIAPPSYETVSRP